MASWMDKIRKLAAGEEDLAPRTWSSLKKPIVTREEWGAQPPTEMTQLRFPVGNVLFTQTRTEECKNKDHCTWIVQQLQKKHTCEEGLPDIQYNFIVGGDKNVYEGRGWNWRPDRNEKYTELFDECIEIAYIGYYEDEQPPMKIVKPAWDVLEDGLLADRLIVRFRVTEDYYQPSSRVEELERKYVKKKQK